MVHGTLTLCLKRQRNDHAQGFCYTGANGIALAGWQATMNNNFMMVAPFAPRWAPVVVFPPLWSENGVRHSSRRSLLSLTPTPRRGKYNILHNFYCKLFSLLVELLGASFEFFGADGFSSS